MKRPALSKDLVPVKELRSNLATWLGKLDEDGRPLVVTQRGRAAAVLIHPARLDELEEREELVRKVLRGLSEIQAGELLADEDVWAEVERELAGA